MIFPKEGKDEGGGRRMKVEGDNKERKRERAPKEATHGRTGDRHTNPSPLPHRSTVKSSIFNN